MSSSTYHEGGCHNGAGHSTIVLIVQVEEGDAEFVHNALALMRSGLMGSYITREKTYGCAFEGPLTIQREDRVILQAIADESEGRFEHDAKEPDIILEKALLAGIRAIASNFSLSATAGSLGSIRAGG